MNIVSTSDICKNINSGQSNLLNSSNLADVSRDAMLCIDQSEQLNAHFDPLFMHSHTMSMYWDAVLENAV